MRVTVRLRRVALRFIPAAVAASGLVIAGCDDGRESPVAPSGPEQNAPIAQTDKEINAVDLGPPAASSLSLASATLASTVAPAATSIPFGPEPGPFGNPGPSCDDCVFGGLPIGFSFTFFGNSYTTFNLSSNGFIGFGPNTSHGCCSGQPIPSADGINNLIAAAWTDLYPGGGGAVSYETRGSAPNRRLIVNYEDIPWCCETGVNRVSTQIILYEGTNVIEIHTANQSVGHIYTQGVEDASGTQAVFIPGRVAANFGYVNDAVRFTTQTAWAARAPLPSARRGLAAWGVNGLLYAIGGSNSAGTVLTTVQAYNPSTNSWSSRASLPAARQTGNGAVAINGIIYLAGGHDAAGALTRTLYAYNTSTNTWSTKATMPVYSSCGGSAVYAAKLYVFSGCTRSSTGAQVPAAFLHRYDPSSNTWTTLRAAPASHFQPVVGVISGKLYVVGGNNASNIATGRVDMYNPSTNGWSIKATMPTARVAAAGSAIGGKLHVIGGRNGSTYLSTVEAYNPLTNSWISQASMPTGRAAFGVGGISGFLYAVGGRNSGSVLATNERYTP
jgi:N-acetylneuraminic acid mutarotase